MAEATGVFIHVRNARPKSECACQKPFSNGGEDFGQYTVWACLNCGKAWQLSSISVERRPGAIPVDTWERYPACDILEVRKTQQKYNHGDNTY